MDKTHCHYHPAQPATWHCPACPRDYGDCCLPQNADATDDDPRCPLCRGGLTFLGAANSAQPFWERISTFFRYALQSGPLAFAGLLTLASLFMPSSKILWIALLSVATKYLHSVIEASSQALQEAPSLQSAFVGEGFGLFFKQLAVFLLAGAALWLAADFDSEALFWGVNLLIMLVMPASSAMERGTVPAITPVPAAAGFMSTRPAEGL